MIISPKRTLILYTIFLWCFCTVFPLFYYFVFDSNIAAIICGILFQLLMIRFFIAYFKTIEITQDGCTVKLLCFKRKYQWSDLKTKRIENYESRLFGRSDYYEKGVVFSTRKNFCTPELIGISTYLLFCLNPFKFFVILFKPSFKKVSIPTYEVDEEEFMKYMSAINITIS